MTIIEVQVPQFNPTNGLPDPPPPPAPPVSDLGGLVPLTEAQIGAELKGGLSCDLTEQGGPPLLAATLGDAIVNDDGRIIHLKPQAKDWNALVQGGRFIGKDLVVEINAGRVLTRGGTLVVRATGVEVKRGRYGFGVSHGPSWMCWS